MRHCFRRARSLEERHCCWTEERRIEKRRGCSVELGYEGIVASKTVNSRVADGGRRDWKGPESDRGSRNICGAGAIHGYCGGIRHYSGRVIKVSRVLQISASAELADESHRAIPLSRVCGLITALRHWEVVCIRRARDVSVAKSIQHHPFDNAGRF